MLTKASYSMIAGAPYNVKDYGAVGDGVTDDTAAIQLVLDKAYKTANASYANQTTARKYAIEIYFPPGEYLVSDQLILGEPGKWTWYVTMQMNGATIHSTHTGADGAFVIESIQHGVFNGLNVLSDTVTAIRINNSFGSSYRDVSAGAGTGAFSAIHITGVMFDNVFQNVGMQQFAGTAGATYCWYWDTTTTIAPAVFAGGPINRFDGLYMSNAPYSMYWYNLTDAVISSVEHEGFGTSYTVPDFDRNTSLFKNCARVHISEVYQEAVNPQANFLVFEDCEFITVRNIKGGSYYHFQKFKNCKYVDIQNMESCLRIEGTNYYFNIDNWRALTDNTKNAMPQIGTAYIYNLNVRNLVVRDQLDTLTRALFPQISSGTLSQSNNIILNPRCLNSGGNVTNYYCSVTNNGSYQDISPLGILESVVEVTNTTNFIRIEPDFDLTLLSQAKSNKCVIVMAWKARNLPAGFTAVTSAGDQNVDPYGQLIYNHGDWLLSYCLYDIDPAVTTNAVIVNNYNAIYNVGDKFLFGGAILLPTQEVRLPSKTEA